MEQNSVVPNKFKIIFFVLIILTICSLALSTLLFFKINKADSAETSEEEIRDITKEIGHFMVLPKDEVPTLITVTDLNEVKDQPFFKNALVGDKVLVYVKQGRAILWRPSVKKIIEFLPVNFSAF